jgi:hypothetical protein
VSALRSTKVGIRLCSYGVKIAAPPPSDFCGTDAFVSTNGYLLPEVYKPEVA